MRHLWRIFAVLLMIGLCLIYAYFISFQPVISLDDNVNRGYGCLFPEDNCYGDRIQSQLQYTQKQNEHPVMIYQSPDITNTIKLGYYQFKKDRCPISNCFLASSENDMRSADVLLFADDSSLNMSLPRRSSQLWIMRLLESPENTSDLKKYNGLVNYTASYRMDSDIPIPYGYWKYGQRKWTHQYPMKNKLKEVLWLVSNCITNNGRMKYAKELGKYIQLDIFGKCGEFSPTKKDAERMLNDQYKFYLSFENSNCRDYVTEKLFENALSNNIIPVVMGAEKDFYEKIVPAGSFIYAEDFTSPKELASYLRYLGENRTAYNDYFTWKSQGDFVSSYFYCRLCALVQKPRRKVYNDLHNWWHSSDDCPRRRYYN